MQTNELHPITPTISFAATNGEVMSNVEVDTGSLVAFMRELGLSDAEISETSIHFSPNVEQERNSYDHKTKTVCATTDMDGDFTRTSTRITLAPEDVKQKVDTTFSKMLTNSLSFGLNSRATYVKYEAAKAEAERQKRIRRPLYALSAALGGTALCIGSAIELAPNAITASAIAAAGSCAWNAFMASRRLNNKPPFRFATPEFPVGVKNVFPKANIVTVSSRRLPM